MTTETKQELLAYGAEVRCFLALSSEVTGRMRDAGFIRYSAADHPPASALAFVYGEPIMRGSSPTMPALPQSVTVSTRYLAARVFLGPTISDGLPLEGRRLLGGCGEEHVTDSNGCAACWACFMGAVVSGKFCG